MKHIYTVPETYSTFRFLCSFTVCSLCAQCAFIVHSFAFCVHSLLEITIHKTFNIRSPSVHWSFTKRSLFIQGSGFNTESWTGQTWGTEEIWSCSANITADPKHRELHCLNSKLAQINMLTFIQHTIPNFFILLVLLGEKCILYTTVFFFLHTENILHGLDTSN